MANIMEYLKNILKSNYGKDVRDSIHGGIYAINKEVEENTTKQNLLEQKYNEQIKNLANQDPQLPEIVDARCGFDTLGELLKKKIYHFNNVEDMKKCLSLEAGEVCQTEGLENKKDKMGDMYEVVDKTNQLFDIENVLTEIGYYNGSGQFVTNSPSNIAFLLFRLPLGEITISSNYSLKKLIGLSSSDYSQGTIITSTIGNAYTFENDGTYNYFATYASISDYNQSDFHIMMNKGNTPLPYEEYKEVEGIELDNGLIAQKIIDSKKERSFINESITIEERIFTDETTKTKYWITKIPRYDEDGNINELKLGFANNENENMLTPQTARDFSNMKNATVVINAGVSWNSYQGVEYDGANMHGLRVLEHELISNNYENEWYKKTHYALGIKDDGTLVTFGTPDSNGDVYQSYEKSQELDCKYVTSAFTPIMLNGVSQKNILPYTNQWVDGNDEDIYYQRQVIGQNSSTKDIFILTSNGKGTDTEDGLVIDKGMKLDDCIAILQNLGCDFAYQLDEGGSTSLVYRGKIINNITDDNGTSERLLSDFLYVAKEINTDKDKDIFENQKEIGNILQNLKNVPKLNKETGNLKVPNGVMGFFPAVLPAIYHESLIPKYSSVFLYYRTAENAPYASNNAICLSFALWDVEGNQMLQIAFPHAGDPTVAGLKPKYRSKVFDEDTQTYKYNNWVDIG